VVQPERSSSLDWYGPLLVPRTPRGSDFILALSPPDPLRPAPPAYRWLAGALRAAILEGRVKPGTRLPSTRFLAGRFGLSRGTVVTAFDELTAEGYLEGTIGSGTFVNRVLPEDLLLLSRPPGGRQPPQRTAPSPGPKRSSAEISKFGRRARRLETSVERPPRAFRANEPALDLFPAARWSQIAARVLRRGETIRRSDVDPLGDRPLREGLADYLGASRGVRATADRVAIVSGIQEALALIARVLLDPDDAVCLEDPGYVGADRVFEALGARVVSVSVDAEGMTVPPPDLRRVRLAYLTPAHQFPTCVSMSLPRRLAILDWARRSGAWLFEDDYDAEYRYSGRPLPALQGIDSEGAVIFAGSLSKVMFPTLRLGYVVLPDALVEPFAAAKSITSRHTPLLEQTVLAEFLSSGDFARHLRRMREIYAERSSALADAARRHLDGRLALAPVEAGLQTAGWLTQPQHAAAIERAAIERGLEVLKLSNYRRRATSPGEPEPDGLQLGFAAVDARELERGAGELAAVIDEVARPHRRRPRR
jgi:GntR family transcriptional regulator/MocR family aminotransferase